MATRNRDVRLGVEIQTTGEEALRKAAAEIRSFAREGGEAATQFNALAAEFEQLAAAAASAAGLRSLNEELERTSAASREASATADVLTQQYAEQRAQLDQLRAQQAQAAEAVRQAGLALTQANGELKIYGAGVSKATKDTEGYKDRLKELTANAQDAKLQLASKRAELERIVAPLREAEQAERRLAAQSLAASEAARAAANAVRERAEALQRAEAAALAAGVSTENLAAAEQRIAASAKAAADAANRLAQEQRDGAAAAAALADIDAQLAGVQERLQSTLVRSAQAYDEEIASLREAAAAAERKAQADFDAAEAGDRLTRARELGRAAVESELAALREAQVFSERYAQSQREAAAAAAALSTAVTKLEDDLDRQAATVRGNLVTAMAQASDAYEREIAALNAAARAAERKEAATREQAEADRLAAIEARGLAEAQERGRVAAQAELAAIRESEAFVRRYTQAKEEAIARTREFIAQSGAAVERAFGAAGLRSIQAIDAEIDEVNRSMNVLQQEFLAGRISVQDFDRAMAGAAVRIATLNREIQTIPGNVSRIEELADGVNALVTRFGALTAAVATIGFAAKPIIDATVALDQMRRVLTTVSGSAEQAEQQIEFLRETSRRSGQQFDQLGQSYAKFAASALQSGLSLSDTQQVFESVALAAGNLGLSSDQSRRALEALSQIASKGVVSMEELRQQLGDALPGVLPLLATELGLTQQELNKLVESGQLLAGEAIPAIGRALTKLGPGRGEVEGLVATWNRFVNVLKQAGTTLVEGPFGQTAAVFLTAFAGALRDVLFVVVAASEGVEVLGKTLLATGEAIKNGTIATKQFRDELDRIATESAEDLESFRKTAFGTTEETKRLAEAGKTAGQSFSKLAVEQQKTIEAAEARTRNSEKLAQAVEIEAASVERNVIALLDEREAAQRSVEVAERVAAARDAAADAAEAEASSLREARRQAVADAEARGKSTESIKAYLEALDEKIQKADADAEKTRAQATAAREAADAAKFAADTFGDQSDQLVRLQEEVKKARDNLDGIVLQFQAGETGAKQLTEAENALAKAKKALRDATDDLSDAMERELDLMRSEFAVKEASLKLELERVKNERVQAELRGNAFQARQLGIRQAELELAITRTGTDLKLNEIDVQLQALSTQEQVLRSTRQLTPEKELEIRTRRNNLIAQTLETQASVEGTRQQEENVNAMKRGVTARGEHTSAVNTSTGAARTNTGEIERNTGAMERNKSATDAATEARRKYNELLASDRVLGGPDGLAAGINNGGDSIRSPNDGTANNLLGPRPPGGITQGGGFSLRPPPGDGWTFVPDQRAFGGVSPADGVAGRYPVAPTSTRVAVNGVGYWVRSQTDANTSSAKSGAQTYDSPFGGYAGSSQQRADQAAARTVTVNLNVNGGKPIPVTTTESDAERLLRELELAKGTGG